MGFDIAIALLVLYAFWRGYERGAVEIVGSVVIFIAALLIATIFGSQVGKTILGNSYLHPVVGFFIVFFVLMLFGTFITRRIKPKHGILSGLDKILGAGLNVVRMVLFIGLVAAFLRLFNIPPTSSIQHSRLYKYPIKATALIANQLRPLASEVSEKVMDATDSIMNNR